MARFNTKTVNRKVTVNRAGGKAYKTTTELELVSILLTSFVKDQYYRNASDTMDQVTNIIGGLKDKKFAGKAAIYARTKFGMRSITHVTAGELAKQVKGQEWVKKFIEKVVYRPDDMMEIVSYYGSKYGLKPLPNSIKKGIARAFDKFDGYQLGKYRGESKDVSLVDLVNLVHPRPNRKNEEALKQLVEGKLRSKDTWEKNLTQAGQKAKTDEEKAELKADVWKGLVKERKIGYFALLRNLRNILEQAPDLIDDAIALLTEEKLIKKSLVLPFRYLTAVREIEKLNSTGARKVIKALNKAIDISLNNVPKFEGENLVVLDESGSMEGQPQEIGSLFSAILVKTNDCDFMKFQEDARYMTLNSADSTLTLADKIAKDYRAGGTNFNAIFRKANKKYDRIIILSDMQGWMEDSYSYYGNGGSPNKSFAEYKKKYKANPFVYSFDLQGYGDLMFPQEKVFCLAGFSDKVMDLMKILEQDRQALINEINKVEL